MLGVVDVVCLQVDGPTFWEALNEAVLPRIAQIATNQATAEDEEGNFMADVAEAAEVKEEAAQDAAEELGAFLQTATLEKGTEVTLRCSPDGELHVAVDGGDGKTFASAELCEVRRWVSLSSQHPPLTAKERLDSSP
jgi:ATP-dependent RNA helicase DHX36